MPAMWDTGLRRKFFLISFLVIFTSMASIGVILLYYFHSERLSYIDDQIRQTATAIIDSKLLELKTYDYEKAVEIISEELGPDSVDKFFIVRNEQTGEILFQTQNIERLEVNIDRKPLWVTLSLPKYFVRLVNLDLPRVPNRTMQVGVITDAKSMSLVYVSKTTWMMVALILSLMLVLTWGLSSYLFSAIHSLALYINSVTKSFEANADLPAMPMSLEVGAGPVPHGDEFLNLLAVLKGMVEKINVNRKFMKTWSFQMAHELKTPLTILNRDFELVTQRYGVDQDTKNEIQANIDKISETISGFLSWAETVSSRQVDNLYAVHVDRVWQQEELNFEKVFSGRIRLLPSKDFLVLCNPLHLEQVIRNLVGNALKYSEGAVEVQFSDLELIVKDHGPGIPDEVLGRLGAPFNKGLGSGPVGGVGLGLAWVKTICEIYSWELHWDNSGGTTARVRFKNWPL